MSLDAEETQRIALGWIELHRRSGETRGREPFFWAHERLDALTRDAPEDAWEVIAKIRELDGSPRMLSNLAAGPLEDLLVFHGARFIDRVEAAARRDRQFRALLAGVWRNAIPEAIWSRIRALLD